MGKSPTGFEPTTCRLQYNAFTWSGYAIRLMKKNYITSGYFGGFIL